MTSGKKAGKIIILMIIIISLSLFVKENVATIVKVEGSSMFPTLVSGEYLVLNRLSNEFNYGDIVVCKADGKLLIKRVIGVGGDSVRILDGWLYLNGKRVYEPWFREKMSQDFEEVKVKYGFYFLMGDNREYSTDSRSERVGSIPKESIIGKIVFKK